MNQSEGLAPYYEINIKKQDTLPPFVRDAQVKILGGPGYRLPTDAEWDHASLAGSSAKFHFGDRTEDLDEYAWHKLNSGARTHSVGEKKPNPYGLYDMLGNVAEWVDDLPPAEDDKRKIRGGSHVTTRELSVSSHRPSFPASTNSNAWGFRVARDAGGKSN